MCTANIYKQRYSINYGIFNINDKSRMDRTKCPVPPPAQLLPNLCSPLKTFAWSSQLGPPLNTVVPANIWSSQLGSPVRAFPNLFLCFSQEQKTLWEGGITDIPEHLPVFLLGIVNIVGGGDSGTQCLNRHDHNHQLQQASNNTGGCQRRIMVNKVFIFK